MKRVLILQPSLQPPGGGSAVAAWILEALKDDYELHLFAWEPQRLAPVNREYGTDLRPSDFTLHVVPATVRRLLRLAPIPLGDSPRCLGGRN